MKNEYKIDKVLYDRWRVFRRKQNLINTNIFHDKAIKKKQETKQFGF